MQICKLDIFLSGFFFLNENDNSWVDILIKKLDRKCKREYQINKKSKKWKFLKETYEEKLREVKAKYYDDIVEDLTESDKGKGCSKLKKMSFDEKNMYENFYVESLANYSIDIQAEKIVDYFAKVSYGNEALNLYQLDLIGPILTCPDLTY